MNDYINVFVCLCTGFVSFSRYMDFLLKRPKKCVLFLKPMCQIHGVIVMLNFSLSSRLRRKAEKLSGKDKALRKFCWAINFRSNKLCFALFIHMIWRWVCFQYSYLTSREKDVFSILCIQNSCTCSIIFKISKWSQNNN